MSDFEKINVYLPDDIIRTLLFDAKLFDVTKKDAASVNMNRFLNLIIQGYYEAYSADCSRRTEAILREMDACGVRCPNREGFARRVLNSLAPAEAPVRTERRAGHLSLKPTGETEYILSEIAGGEEPVSRYLCGLLTDYCRKPVFRREQIVFRRNYTLLQEACRGRREVVFSMKGDAKRLYRAVPREIVPGNDEMLNYVLCRETGEKTGKSWASSFRLGRIVHPRMTGNVCAIEPRVADYLDLMKKYGPQDAINDREEVCVRLSQRGLKQFARMYHRRPIEDRREALPDGALLYFTCSKKQIFLYFKRFEFRDAEIVEPASMREDMRKFHIRAIRTAAEQRPSG